MDNRHPLDPLTFEEIVETRHLLISAQSLQHYHRFVYVMNEEPEQDALLSLKPGAQLDRVVFACILDSKHNKTYEARVNLTNKSIKSWKKLPFDKPPYGQAPILPEDSLKCEKIVKADSAWRAAMKKRNLTDKDIDLIQVDSFSVGFLNGEEEKGKRLVKAIGYLREELKDNGYARPIDGVVAVVDLTKKEIVRLEEETKYIPIPKQKYNYDRQSINHMRAPLKPLEITQPEGPGFKVNGWEVAWQDWKFRIGFNQREGLVLNTISFHDNDRDRPIIHRASVTEMVVPYADPSMSHYFKAAFDAGENGFGRCANQLELNCDCLGYIHYFDVPMADENGNPNVLKHAICMHEEDAGPIAKHDEHRSGVKETRRGRELVISFSSTIDNYTYIFYWRLCLDGTIKLEIRLTGIVQTAAITPGVDYPWGGKLTAELAAPLHQHLFNVRLHMSVDGPNNAVSESEFGPLPVSAVNPHGNAFGFNQVYLKTESQGARKANAATDRSWKIFNSSFTNSIGQPTAYKIDIPQTPLLFADKSSSLSERAGFAKKALWITQYDSLQKYAPGDYPNQHAGGDGLPAYIKMNRSIFNKKIVLWPVIGITHFPRPEDFPLMPIAKVGLEMKPFGFFNTSPVVNLAPEKNMTSVDEKDICGCEENSQVVKPNLGL